MARPYDLLDRMRRSKAGWHLRDLDRLYIGFGFERVEGSKHVLYIHSRYSELRATVTRSTTIPKGYISHAVQLIDDMIGREERREI